MADIVLQTDRLILRAWRDADVDPFVAICGDPAVMAHLGGIQSHPDVAAAIARQRAVQAAQGHCFWAIERRSDGVRIGFCGLRVGGHPGTPVADELEIGWRLAKDSWGRGYAREAAEAAIGWGWAHTDRARIAAWTVPANAASWGLMRRIGMTHRPELDFDHPEFASGHPLCSHVVYTIDRPAHG